MARGMVAHHVVGEDRVEFRFHPCEAHSQGEFAGNFDLFLETKPFLKPDRVIEMLRMKVPGDQKLMCVLGSRVARGGLELTFHSEAAKDGDPVPAKVDLYWGSDGDTYLGTLRCGPAPDEPQGEAEGDTGRPKSAGCLGLIFGVGTSLVILGALLLWWMLG